MARLFIAALRLAGHHVDTASSFRSLDIAGNASRQRRLRRLGTALATRWLRTKGGAPPDLWFTYHLFHKAPDWLGPQVCAQLRIPYVVAEASYAPKQACGRWAHGHNAVAEALRQASRVVCLNPEDVTCIHELLGRKAQIAVLRPFLNTAPPRRAFSERVHHRRVLAQRLAIDPQVPWIAVTAMMRPGDKLASYRLLGETLQVLAGRAWVLLVAGGGAAQPEVSAALDFGDRVRFLGVLEHGEVDALHAAADLGVWPAINEAYGMALLEAQAAGLPLVVGERPGVRELIDDGNTGIVVDPVCSEALSASIAALLDDPDRRVAMADSAIRRSHREHDLSAAAVWLDRIVSDAARPVAPQECR